MVDIMGMMKKAHAMQAKLQDAQDELAKLEVEGASGAGMVRVSLSAKGELRSVHIDPSLMTPADKEMVEDLFVAAHADAKKKADALAADKMREVTADLPLPPGMKFPF
jgi:nucleoid-associated protein EbfC